MKRLLRVCLPALAIASIVSSERVSAEPVPSVRVLFEVLSPTLAQQWGPSASGVATDVQRALTKQLKDRFPHWDYEAFNAADGMPAFQLLFQVADDNARALSFQVLLRTSNNATTPVLTENWLPRDKILLQGYPSPTTAAGDIVRAISSVILDRHERDVRGWLSQLVPIADGAHWIPEAPPSMVLALPWSRYEALRESLFRLVCNWPNKGTAFIESRGPGLPAQPYLPPDMAPNPPFDGVVVVALEVEHLGVRQPVGQIDRAELFKLRPRFIFLKEYLPAVSGWNVGGQP